MTTTEEWNDSFSYQIQALNYRAKELCDAVLDALNQTPIKHLILQTRFGRQRAMQRFVMVLASEKRYDKLSFQSQCKMFVPLARVAESMDMFAKAFSRVSQR